jgi:hypothetical protein
MSSLAPPPSACPSAASSAFPMSSLHHLTQLGHHVSALKSHHSPTVHKDGPAGVVFWDQLPAKTGSAHPVAVTIVGLDITVVDNMTPQDCHSGIHACTSSVTCLTRGGRCGMDDPPAGTQLSSVELPRRSGQTEFRGGPRRLFGSPA